MTSKLIIALNMNLVDSIHFNIQCRQAHWNVKGRNFLSFHELFDKIYTASGEWSDLIAERIAHLGGIAKCNIETIASHTRLEPYDDRLADGMDHVRALIDSLSVFLKDITKTHKMASKMGDDDTADILGEVSRAGNKYLWFLRSFEDPR